MNEAPVIATPETHPAHEVVGHYFRNWDGDICYCDSQDDNGYWMTVIKPSADPAFGIERARMNVSTRAIGRTYHAIHFYIEREYMHEQGKALFDFIAGHKAGLVAA